MAETEWVNRYIIRVPVAQAAAANAEAAKWDPDTGGANTFSKGQGSGVRLSTGGKEPASDTLCETALTKEMLAKVQKVAAAMPQMRLYDVNAGQDLAQVLSVAKLKLIEVAEVAEELVGKGL